MEGMFHELFIVAVLTAKRLYEQLSDKSFGLKCGGIED
jgi:hypothetical protein